MVPIGWTAKSKDQGSHAPEDPVSKDSAEGKPEEGYRQACPVPRPR